VIVKYNVDTSTAIKDKGKKGKKGKRTRHEEKNVKMSEDRNEAANTLTQTNKKEIAGDKERHILGFVGVHHCRIHWDQNRLPRRKRIIVANMISYPHHVRSYETKKGGREILPLMVSCCLRARPPPVFPCG
jgi:hypothetical protein